MNVKKGLYLLLVLSFVLVGGYAVWASSVEDKLVNKRCAGAKDWKLAAALSENTGTFLNGNYNVLTDALKGGCDVKIVALSSNGGVDSSFLCANVYTGYGGGGEELFSCQGDLSLSMSPDKFEQDATVLAGSFFEYIKEPTEAKANVSVSQGTFDGDKYNWANKVDDSIAVYKIFIRK